MKIQDAAKNDDNPITKKTFDDAVTSGFHYCNNLAHNNNTETRFVSSGVNVLMSNSACLSVINNALINQESDFMRFISWLQRTSARRESDLLITSMITDGTGRQEVLSPVKTSVIRFHKKKLVINSAKCETTACANTDLLSQVMKKFSSNCDPL